MKGTRGWQALNWFLLIVALFLALLLAHDPLPSDAATIKPPVVGYFKTLAPGSVLPGDKACAARVHRSTWEPRPDNYKANHFMPDRKAVHRAFAIRPFGAAKMDGYVLPRVTGHFTGTTDQIIQWAACKWGISDNVLRAQAEQESTWYNYLVYNKNLHPVSYYGAGDFFTSRSRASAVFATEISRYGYNYASVYNGLVPQTFSIAGIKAWQDPSWGKMRGNQNGTFPFSRNSTAFSMDYLGGYLRAVYEGWIPWLGKTRGDLWGAVGSWYSGDWHSGAANKYISEVKTKIREKHWLRPGWKYNKPPCSSKWGCPRGLKAGEVY